MVKVSIEELCETADSLIAPVRLGVARPTAPFSLATSVNEIINVSYRTYFFKLYLTIFAKLILYRVPKNCF